jgi:hypothetical protein
MFLVEFGKKARMREDEVEEHSEIRATEGKFLTGVKKGVKLTRGHFLIHMLPS